MRYTLNMRRADWYAMMERAGFTREETETLRRAEMTLRRWSERECGTDSGCIERDEATGKAYWLNANTGRRYPVRDLESGALRRVAAVMACRPGWTYYHQTDPRGAALYVLRPGDVPRGEDAASYYNRGLCCCCP